MLGLPNATDPGNTMLMMLVACAGVALFEVARGVGRGLKEYLYRWLTGRDWVE